MMLLHLCWLLMLGSTQGFHVLFHHNLGRPSHIWQMVPMIEELLQHGNQVTSMFFSPTTIVHANYTELLLPSDFGDLMWEVNKVVDGKQMVEKGFNSTNRVLNNLMDPTRWYEDYKMMDQTMDIAGRGAIEPAHIQKFLKSKVKIDAVVAIFPHMAATVAEIFDCRIILYSPSGPLFHFSWAEGRLYNPSLIPLPTASFAEPMSLRQRLQNHLLLWTSVTMVDWIGERIQAQAKEILEMELPHATETIAKRSSIILSSSHPVTHGSWQYPENVIQVSGMTLQRPNSLPTHLEEFIHKAKKDVMLVSFGSDMQPQKMPPHKLEIIIKTFQSLDMKIIWKWTEDVPNLPSNVLIQSWIPQQDLLGHPQVKLFLSHGGLGSLTESLFHSKPLVAIPFSNDQKQNMQRASKLGYSKYVDWDSFTVPELVATIEASLADDKMKQNIEKYRALYLDRDQNPKEKAAWWIEYVCRHGKADLLRADLKEIGYFPLHHIDLLTIICFVIFCSALFFLTMCKFLLTFSKKTKLKSA